MRARSEEVRGGALGLSVETHPGSEWDDCVRDAGGTFCHLAGWHHVMAEVMGREPLYLGARDERGRLVGVLPLVSVRSVLFGHYLVSMPYLNYGGPLGPPGARRLLSRAALERARSHEVDLLELRSRPAPPGGPARNGAPGGDVAEVPGLSVNERKVTVLLRLPDDPEVLWKEGLRSKVRSQVRRPMKEGLEVRFGTEQVGPFYQVFARNMRDLGTPVLPRRLFEALPSVFADAVRFACVYRHGEAVAAGCGFRFGGEFEITWASSLREHSRLAPNMLLYWRMMEKAIEDGAEVFNFGRCSPGGGTHRFKRQWGGEDELLPWVVWSGDGADATPNPDESRYRLATRVWRRLPLPVASALGPHLARRIP
jgi:serine/alanine adding enzyme